MSRSGGGNGRGQSRRGGQRRGSGQSRSASQQGGRSQPRSGGRPVARSGGRPTGNIDDSTSDRRAPGAGSARKQREPKRQDRSRSLGGDQVEGRQAVRELLLAGRRSVREVLIASDRDGSEVLDDIAELAADLRVPVREVSRQKLLAMARTEAPQGVIARAREVAPVDIEDLIANSNEQPPFLLALDGVTDPGNLGALLRSADCAGVTGIVLPRHRAVHLTPTVTKAAAGAVEYLPMTLVGGMASAVSQMRSAGVSVLGLDMGGERQLFELANPLAQGPVCLVLGAEGRGLSRLVRQRCDEVVGIPLLGHLASLNVAAAGALACFEIARRRLL